MKRPDNPLPFEPDEGEEILWTLHKPLPGGSIKLRILLWCVAVVLGILALALLSSDFALAFVLGAVALLCVSGAEHSCTNAPHRISYVLSNRRAFIIETPVKRGKPATVIAFRVRRDMVGRVLRRSSGVSTEKKARKLTFDKLIIDMDAFELTVDDRKVDIMKKKVIRAFSAVPRETRASASGFSAAVRLSV